MGSSAGRSVPAERADASTCNLSAARRLCPDARRGAGRGDGPCALRRTPFRSRGPRGRRRARRFSRPRGTGAAGRKPSGPAPPRPSARRRGLRRPSRRPRERWQGTCDAFSAPPADPLPRGRRGRRSTALQAPSGPVLPSDTGPIPMPRADASRSGARRFGAPAARARPSARRSRTGGRGVSPRARSPVDPPKTRVLGSARPPAAGPGTE